MSWLHESAWNYEHTRATQLQYVTTTHSKPFQSKSKCAKVAQWIAAHVTCYFKRVVTNRELRRVPFSVGRRRAVYRFTIVLNQMKKKPIVAFLAKSRELWHRFKPTTDRRLLHADPPTCTKSLIINYISNAGGNRPIQCVATAQKSAKVNQQTWQVNNAVFQECFGVTVNGTDLHSHTRPHLYRFRWRVKSVPTTLCFHPLPNHSHRDDIVSTQNLHVKDLTPSETTVVWLNQELNT